MCETSEGASVKSISRRGLLKMGAALAAGPAAIRISAAAQRSTTLVGVNMPRFRQLVDESRSYLFGKMNYTLDILS
jgi:hypothetical protein